MSQQQSPALESDRLDPIPISAGSWVVLVVAGVVSFGYHFNYGGINHAHLLPLINYYQDPTTYQNDYINPCYQHFLSYFWYAVAFAARYLDPAILLGATDLVWCILTAWAVYGLAYRLFSSVRAGQLAVVMLVLTKPSPAGIYISLHGSTDPFSHTNFVLPFLLLAWRWGLEGRWLRAWAIVGLMANIHVVSAAFLGCVLGVMMLVNWPRQWWLLLAGPATLLILACPLILRVAAAVGPEQISSPEQIERLRFLYRFRMPYHRFPSTWAVPDWMGALVWTALGAIGFLRLQRGVRDWMMAAAFAVLVAIVAWLYLVVEVWPFSVTLMAFPFGRAGRFAVFIALLYVAGWAARLLESQQLSERFGGLCLACWGVTGVRYVPAAALLLLVGLVPDASRRPAARVSLAVVLSVAGLLVAWSGRITHSYATVVGLIGLGVLILLGEARGWPRSGRWATIGLTVLPAVAAVASRGQNFVLLLYRDFSPGEAIRVAFNMPVPQWIEMQQWVDRNLPRDAVLLTPFHLQGFRIYSKRAIVCEWKDPGIITCSYLPVMFEWERRIRQCTGVQGSSPQDAAELRRRRTLYSFLPERALVRLARQFGAGYIVVEADRQRLSLPLMHQNDRYRLYKLGETAVILPGAVPR